MSEVLKKIGNYEITAEDVEGFIQSLPREQQQYKEIPEFRADVLSRLEEITLFALLGEEMKMEESPVYKQVMANTRRDILGQLALQGMMQELTVTEEEGKAFFEANKARFAVKASANASHILVDSEELAEHILKELENGEITFEDAAKKYSTCPSKDHGGNLGDFAPGQMVPEFNDAVFTGEMGKILGPVQTQFGYHLIMINSRRDAVSPDYEAVAKQAMQMALNQKQEKAYNEKVSELKQKYEA